MCHKEKKHKFRVIEPVMICNQRRMLWWTLVILLVFPNTLYASHPQQRQVIDDIAIYLTIIPAEMLIGHPKNHPESDMHTRTRITGSNQHHIMVTLFNANNGTRLENASIKLNIIGTKFKGLVKKLELMVIGATWGYGNLINIPLTGSYKIELEIQTAGESKVTKAVFQYASI